jgi:hypothetical protein
MPSHPCGCSEAGSPAWRVGDRLPFLRARASDMRKDSSRSFKALLTFPGIVTGASGNSETT